MMFSFRAFSRRFAGKKLGSKQLLSDLIEKKRGYTMILKIILLGICVFTAVGGVFAQEKMTAKTKTAEDAVKTALNVGARIPSFTLADSAGKSVSSKDLLKQSNLVLVFYRGAWCPYCNLYLRNLQKNIKEIEAVGGRLVAVSVENPDNSLSVAQKNELNFTVLSDSNLDVARKFGIVFQLPPETDAKYKAYGIDLVKQNRTAAPDLPLSATYIVNQNGEIVYAFLEPDYTKRAEPAIIIENLAKIKNVKRSKN
jgi:peroxiredoxin